MDDLRACRGEGIHRRRDHDPQVGRHSRAVGLAAALLDGERHGGPVVRSANLHEVRERRELLPAVFGHPDDPECAGRHRVRELHQKSSCDGSRERARSHDADTPTSVDQDRDIVDDRRPPSEARHRLVVRPVDVQPTRRPPDTDAHEGRLFDGHAPACIRPALRHDDVRGGMLRGSAASLLLMGLLDRVLSVPRRARVPCEVGAATSSPPEPGIDVPGYRHDGAERREHERER